MRVEVTDDGAVAVAVVSGEVDLADGTQLSDEILTRMRDVHDSLVVDLSDLRYIDSAGVRCLFEIAATLNRREQPFALAVPPDSLLRSVLKITRMDEVATICANRDDALDAVRNPDQPS